MNAEYRSLLDQRIATTARGWMLAETLLRHFALVTYAAPPERLRPHIPSDRFDIPTFSIAGGERALLSAVPFLDVDFHFRHILPFMKFNFGQTNHRAYVIDRKTGQHVVWFFGTTLGSPLVNVPRRLWGLPWHHARYTFNCTYDESERRYVRYHQTIESNWCSGRIDLEDSGKPASNLEGFENDDAMKLILTHPVQGFFYRRNGRLGTYSIWHPEMSLTIGHARDAYFSLYERLGILNRDEMKSPHSVLICKEVPFQINLPPRNAE